MTNGESVAAEEEGRRSFTVSSEVVGVGRLPALHANVATSTQGRLILASDAIIKFTDEMMQLHRF